MTISNESRGAIKKIFEPIALAMGRIGLTPNGLTLIGFAITAVGAVLTGAQAWVIGGIVVFVGGVFDMFGEILVFIGCIAALGNSNVGTVPILVAAGAMGASIMVSYTRAKSDALGYSSGMGLAAVGIMPREVRLVIISLGIILTGTSIDVSALEFALGIILVGAVITVIQRILHVQSQAKSADNPPVTTTANEHTE